MAEALEIKETKMIIEEVVEVVGELILNQMSKMKERKMEVVVGVMTMEVEIIGEIMIKIWLLQYQKDLRVEVEEEEAVVEEDQ